MDNLVLNDLGTGLMKAFRAVINAMLLSLSLSGCVSLSEFFASFGFGTSSDTVELPEYRVGDSFTFGNPTVTWRVVSIDDQRVTWRSDKGDKQVTGRDPLLPALAWHSERIGSGQRTISDQVGSLFPMKVGARTTFRATVTTDKPPYVWGFDWQCSVMDRQEIAGPKGVIDAFKVGCGREVSDEIVFFYAPSIGHYITKTNNSDGQVAARVKHLVAYEKLNEEGSLERVAFADRPVDSAADTTNFKKRSDVTPTQRVNSEPIIAVSKGQTGPRALEQHAQQLLAQRKSVKEPMPRRILSKQNQGIKTSDVANISPAAGTEVRVAQVLKPKPSYELVQNRIPNFPPRPKANPKRVQVQIAAAPTAPSFPVMPRTVEEIPALPRAVKRDPFDVNIVKKAFAAPEVDREALRKARERAIRTPGLGDEAMLAVTTTSRAKVPPSQAQKATAKTDLSPRTRAPSNPTGSQIASIAKQSRNSAVIGAESSGFYGLHLGTFLGPRKALQGWKYIYRSHKDLLSGLQPRIRRHELAEKGTRYRLRVVPFANAESAAALCERLSKRGKFCRVTQE